MGIPQIIMIVIYGIGLGIHLAKNGEPREDKYSFGIELIAVICEVGLLYWGGFFS